MSYGINAPQGFQEENALISHTSNSATRSYNINSGYGTSIFSGDPVARLTGGLIQIGIAGAAVCGVFKGVVFTDTTNATQYLPYWPANTVTANAQTATAYVIDDPYAEFNIQVTSSNTGVHPATLNLADVGKNANFLIGAGNTGNGLSTTSIDMATIATTATFNCNLLRLTGGFGSTVVGTPGVSTNQQNAFGTLFNNVVVTFNNHVQKGGTGTLGV